MIRAICKGLTYIPLRAAPKPSSMTGLRVLSTFKKNWEGEDPSGLSEEINNEDWLGDNWREPKTVQFAQYPENELSRSPYTQELLALKIESLVSRKINDFTVETQKTASLSAFANQPGFLKLSKIEEIVKKTYKLKIEEKEDIPKIVESLSLRFGEEQITLQWKEPKK